MMKLRAVGLRDLPKVYNIELRSYEYPLGHSLLQGVVESKDGIPFIGVIGDVGVCWALGEYDFNNGVVKIERLATHPEYRMQGFARMALGYIWNEAVKRQATKLFFIIPEYQTLVHDPNSVADFMWKMDFKAVGLEKDHFYHYGRYYDGVRFERAT